MNAMENWRPFGSLSPASRSPRGFFVFLFTRRSFVVFFGPFAASLLLLFILLVFFFFPLVLLFPLLVAVIFIYCRFLFQGLFLFFLLLWLFFCGLLLRIILLASFLLLAFLGRFLLLFLLVLSGLLVRGLLFLSPRSLCSLLHSLLLLRRLLLLFGLLGSLRRPRLLLLSGRPRLLGRLLLLLLGGLFLLRCRRRPRLLLPLYYFFLLLLLLGPVVPHGGGLLLLLLLFLRCGPFLHGLGRVAARRALVLLERPVGGHLRAVLLVVGQRPRLVGRLLPVAQRLPLLPQQLGDVGGAQVGLLLVDGGPHGLRVVQEGAHAPLRRPRVLARGLARLRALLLQVAARGLELGLLPQVALLVPAALLLPHVALLWVHRAPHLPRALDQVLIC
mmetsp:Transcript_43418/g.74955  ORF Transcript_43418/g.74955 Transcript_43418/m.74955 type:complete len:388 (-) Transcript_43418:843-2006(-)